MKFAVIGLGRFGTSIAKSLASKDHEVLAIDSNELRTESIKDDVAYAVALDSTDKKALEAQNLHLMDAVVVAIGENFEALLLTTALLQEIGVPRLISRAATPQQKLILTKIGIKENDILSPEDEVGRTVAEKLLQPNIRSYLPLPDDHEIVEITTPRKAIGKTVKFLGLREYYAINLITIKRGREEEVDGKIETVFHLIAVDGNTQLLEHDIMFLFGKVGKIDAFVSSFS